MPSNWTLVTAFVIDYLTEDDWMRLHANAGYVITGLLVFRLIWGVRWPASCAFFQFRIYTCGVIAGSVLHEENLVRAMITGNKQRAVNKH